MNKLLNSPLKLHYQAAKLGLADFFQGITPYVGYEHNQNLGDVELFHLTRQFFNGRNLATNVLKRGRYFSLSKLRATNYYLVGGGTLIFSENVLKACEWLNNYSLRPVFLGTGAFDIIPEEPQLKRWQNVLKQAKYLGVRGTISQEIIANLGVDAQILGDLGFLVNKQMEQPLPANGEVVIVPRSIRPSFYEYFEKDMGTRRLLAELIKKCLEGGFKVKVLCVSIDDQDVIRGWLKQLPQLEYIEYGGDFDKFKQAISACGCLVSMRMHPGIFATAWGVPTILLDQRHKFFDSFSPLDKKVVDIVDPESIEPDALMERVVSRLEEDWAQRKERHALVAPLASKQLEFFNEIFRFED